MDMKKLIALFLVCVLTLTGCGRNTCTIGITVPAGNRDDFVFSDQAFCPAGKKITVSCGEGLGETEVLLALVDENLAAGYVNTPIAPGAPATFDTSSGDWLKIGVNVANVTDEDKIVYVQITGVEIRIE